MDEIEARRLLRERPDHRLELSKMLRASLAKHGLTKKVLQNEQVRHMISHGYNKRSDDICVHGKMYCRELFDLVPRPKSIFFEPDPREESWEGPVYDYVAGRTIGMSECEFLLNDAFDVPAIESYFEKMVSEAIVPIVMGSQTPLDVVKYALTHDGVLTYVNANKPRVLDLWSKHYGLTRD